VLEKDEKCASANTHARSASALAFVCRLRRGEWMRRSRGEKEVERDFKHLLESNNFASDDGGACNIELWSRAGKLFLE
jgi:hypothetical protein